MITQQVQDFVLLNLGKRIIWQDYAGQNEKLGRIVGWDAYDNSVVLDMIDDRLLARTYNEMYPSYTFLLNDIKHVCYSPSLPYILSHCKILTDNKLDDCDHCGAVNDQPCKNDCPNKANIS